jgi:hypothetical protein
MKGKNELQLEIHSLPFSILLCAWEPDIYEPYQPDLPSGFLLKLVNAEGLPGMQKQKERTVVIQHLLSSCWVDSGCVYC